MQAEWDLLQQLALLNPGRLTGISCEDHIFRLTLRGAPVRLTSSPKGEPVSIHEVRVAYPSFFPASPLEVYIGRAFFHPNVHPETGFVCVWSQHRSEHTIEHALHKLVAMMSGRLYNRETMHKMQPEALSAMLPDIGECKPLTGVAHDRLALPEVARRRTRLS